MKSRISIDLDESNNPIIKIEYAHSDDVRDKMVKRFLDGFDERSMANLVYDNTINQQISTTTARIYPVFNTKNTPVECFIDTSILPIVL